MGLEPLRVCIGTEPRTEIPCKVLGFSIEKHLAPGRAVEITPLRGGDWRGTGPLRQFTGFSLLRWTIPERFDHVGRAIYLDADQLCLADLGALWDETEAHRSGVSCTFREFRPRRRLLPFLRERRTLAETSVMVLDLKHARGRLWSVARIREHLERTPTAAAYDEVMHLTYLDPPPTAIDERWNVMDARGSAAARLLAPDARILHFTRVSTQPWFDPEHPARSLWEQHLGEALDAGCVTRDELEAACARFSITGGRPDGMHPYWQERFVG